MSHTPGPWTAHANAVRTADGNRPIALMATAYEMSANARLMSSAPDLLEALVELVRDGYSEENEERALAAIAKAKGEQT